MTRERWVDVPMFRISVHNQHFSACNEQELATVELARKQAIKGALQIGMTEVTEEKQFFGAEVCIDSDGKQLGRFIVSIGVSPLL